MSGQRPVAMLFVRDVAGALGMLLKQMDETVAQNKAVELRSFAVFLTDDAKATEAKLKDLAAEAKISDDLPLIIPEDAASLKPYKINPDAALTVVLYRRYKVLGNFAFKSGELNEEGVKAIIGAISAIIPSKEELAREAKEDEEAQRKRKLEAEEAERKKKLEAAGKEETK